MSPRRARIDPRRVQLAALINAGRHLEDGRRPVTAGKLAKVLGTTRSTVCHWLRVDHPEVYEEHYQTFAEMWANHQKDRMPSATPIVLDLPDPHEVANEIPEPEFSRSEMMDPIRAHFRDR